MINTSTYRTPFSCVYVITDLAGESKGTPHQIIHHSLSAHSDEQRQLSFFLQLATCTIRIPPPHTKFRKTGNGCTIVPIIQNSNCGLRMLNCSSRHLFRTTKISELQTLMVFARISPYFPSRQHNGFARILSARYMSHAPPVYYRW